MNTIAIVRELADERSLTFFKLSQICDVSHSTLKNSECKFRAVSHTCTEI